LLDVGDRAHVCDGWWGGSRHVVAMAMGIDRRP
jgi:hypothetical protein